VFFLSWAVVGFELEESATRNIYSAIRMCYLLQVWPHLVSCPSLSLPAVEIGLLCPGVHHEVDGTASSKCASTWHDTLSVSELRCLVALVEQCRLCCGLQVLEVENRIDDMRYVFVVSTALDHEDAEVRGVLSEATGDDASCCATWYK
jgi:hypothetical protein